MVSLRRLQVDNTKKGTIARPFLRIKMLFDLVLQQDETRHFLWMLPDP
jgi:hypothetical protein